MTKPSYEEQPECPTCRADAIYGSREDLTTELSRVRGLLQRQWISVEERLPEPSNETPRPWYLLYGNGTLDFGLFLSRDKFFMGRALQGKEITHWQPQPDPPTSPQSSSLVPSGAESADIGKLDSVDKKDLQIVRVLRGLGKNINGGQFEGFVTHIVIPLVEHHWPAGSAETGGEKAALKVWELATEIHELNDKLISELEAAMQMIQRLQSAVRQQLVLRAPIDEHIAKAMAKMACAEADALLATFRQSDKNESVSSGVEGAHEGTTADKTDD